MTASTKGSNEEQEGVGQSTGGVRRDREGRSSIEEPVLAARYPAAAATSCLYQHW
jgi:hypothetical protein